MNKVFLATLAALLMVFSACNNETGINEPVTSAPGESFMKYADRLDLTTDQLAQIDEVFYSGQDMGLILDPDQVVAFHSMIDGALVQAGNDRPDPRKFFDMVAVLWYRMALKANPDLTEDQKTAVKTAIEASNRARIDILRNTELTPEEKRAALQEEHARLMAEINGKDGLPGILTPDQVGKTVLFKEELEKKRREIRERMLERRIDMQIKQWTRILKLNEQQQNDIKDILMGQDDSIKELRELYKDDPEMFRQEMIELQQRINDDIRSKLDDKQKALWDRMHGIRPGGGRG